MIVVGKTEKRLQMNSALPTCEEDLILSDLGLSVITSICLGCLAFQKKHWLLCSCCDVYAVSDLRFGMRAECRKKRPKWGAKVRRKKRVVSTGTVGTDEDASLLAGSSGMRSNANAGIKHLVLCRSDPRTSVVFISLQFETRGNFLSRGTEEIDFPRVVPGVKLPYT
ncbi:hypothetical protein KCV07_g518, partial [Aureobasidium melanogenum]